MNFDFNLLIPNLFSQSFDILFYYAITQLLHIPDVYPSNPQICSIRLIVAAGNLILSFRAIDKLY